MSLKVKGILLIVLLGITSCSDELSSRREESPQGEVVTFVCTLPGVSAANSSPQLRGGAPLGAEGLSTSPSPASAPATRAHDTTWGIADRVGIYMLNAADPDNSSQTWEQRLVAGNQLYITDNTTEDTSVGLFPGSGTTPLCYPIERAAVNFMAYYPYMETVNDDSNNNIYPINVAVSAPQALAATDLLYHTDGTDPETDQPVTYNSQSDEVSLVFNHQLTKLIINLTSEGSEGPEAGQPGFGANPGLVISGMPTTATFNLSTGALANPGDSDVDITAVLSDESNDTAASWEAIIVPHTPTNGGTGFDAANRKFTFTIGTTTFNFALPTTQTFEPGMAYTYRLALINKEVVFLQNTIEDWNAEPLGEEADYLLTPTSTEYTLNWDGTPFTGEDAPLLINFNTERDFGGKVSITAATLTTGVGEAPGSTAVTWLKPTLRDGAVVVIAEPNMTSISRTAYIHINATKTYFSDTDDIIGHDAGSQTFVIKVEQGKSCEPNANCYLLAPGDMICINMNRVAEHVALSGDADAAIGTNDILNVELLWADNADLITTLEPVRHGANGYIRVAVAPDQYGNAGIAVKVGDVIKWSWHIWVPEVGYIGNMRTASGFMDRNLGATTNGATVETQAVLSTFGLLYQWGRKDPFPGAASATNTYSNPTWWSKITSSSDVKLFIKKPMTFMNIWSGSDGMDSWQKSGAKTIYDPCPEGYQVPANGSWGSGMLSNATAIAAAGWLSWNMGYTNDNYGGYYPATGYRGNNGSITSVSRAGNCWSSEPYMGSSSKAYFLDFYSGNLKTQTYAVSILGLSVRCKAIE